MLIGSRRRDCGSTRVAVSASASITADTRSCSAACHCGEKSANRRLNAETDRVSAFAGEGPSEVRNSLNVITTGDDR